MKKLLILVLCVFAYNYWDQSRLLPKDEVKTVFITKAGGQPPEPLWADILGGVGAIMCVFGFYYVVSDSLYRK